MSDKNFLTKNSQYIDSLVSFILDTKPYHSKLTEVVEEYRFAETINVKFDERLLIKAKLSPTWSYNYFSGANPAFRTMPAKRLVVPGFQQLRYVAGADENTDLAMVPYVYSKKAFDNVGVNTVFVERANKVQEPQTESVDFFQSHGSFQFQIKQTYNANGDLDPTWVATNEDGVVAQATLKARELALDIGDPKSSFNQIQGILDGIQVKAAGNAPILAELDRLYDILNTPDLPNSYEVLFALLGQTALYTQAQLTALKNELSRLSPEIYFLTYGDANTFPRGATFPASPALDSYFYKTVASPNFPIGLYKFDGTAWELTKFPTTGGRQSGALSYATTENAYLRVRNVVNNPNYSFEEWTLTAIDPDAPIYSVSGSSSGFVGFVTAGQAFNHSRVTFSTTNLAQPPVGSTLTLSPVNQIVVHGAAPLETWNIIKVNPIAHDRPVFTSPHYGHIVDQSGTIGRVTLLSSSIPTTTFSFTARTGGTVFDVKSSADSTYSGVAQVNVPFNDGVIAFTLKQGTSSAFRTGDTLYVSVENLPAQAEDLNIGYGYDLDPYDDTTTVYSTVSGNANYNKPIGFYYDGRFTDFNLEALGLTIAQSAVDGRKWRIKAVPNGAHVATVTKDGSGTSSISYNLPANPATADLLIYLSTQFQVEYSDNDFTTATSIGTISVGNTFNSATHGISFTLVPASRPYIGVSSLDTGGTRVTGGDVFSFTVRNPQPTISDVVGISGPNVPRLIMHSDDFYGAEAAKWTLTFTSTLSYVLSAVRTGENAGTPLFTPITLNAGTTGMSYKGNGVHYTIVRNSGMRAGDTFTFETFAEKPSYLVHGSVTGWTGAATVGKYFWNGKIGFKINPPVGNVFVNDLLVNPSTLNLTYSLREDAPELVYTFTPTTSGYIVTRSDIGVSGFTASTGTFKDKYLTATLSGTTGTFKISVENHDFKLWNAQDVIILKPATSSRLPKPGETVIVEKTENDALSINLMPSTVNATALSPITIDQRFIDLNTNQPIPLSATSPETSILSGWLPITLEHIDSGTSIAEFSDVATKHIIKSAANGQKIGELRQLGTGLNEPIIFEWDTAFFNTYLPLNQEANLVFHSSGWNDKVRVNMTEGIKFLIGGGALAEDWLFKDEVSVEIAEDSQWGINLSWDQAVSVAVADGPLTGFMTGFDNLGFDSETANGFYDAGQSLTGYYHEAMELEALGSRTAEQEARYQDLLDLIDPYLDGSLSNTTLVEFLANLNATATEPLTTSDFGFPLVGMGMQINERPDDASSTVIQEAMTVILNDRANGHDTQGYDIGPLDSQADVTAVVYSGSLPPVPVSIPPGSTYASLDTPLTVSVPARVFEITFNASPAQLSALSPTFSIWLPGAAAPQQVAVIERISLAKFRFSIPRASEAKIIVG